MVPAMTPLLNRAREAFSKAAAYLQDKGEDAVSEFNDVRNEIASPKRRRYVKDMLALAQKGQGVTSVKAFRDFENATSWNMRARLGLDMHKRDALGARVYREAVTSYYFAAAKADDPVDALNFASEAGLYLRLMEVYTWNKADDKDFMNVMETRLKSIRENPAGMADFPTRAFSQPSANAIH